MERDKKIIVTTPDYPPMKIGGLATLSHTIVTSLRQNGQDVQILQWNRPKEVKKLKRQRIINIHVWPLLYLQENQCQGAINFIHGSEIIPYSKNPLVHFIKRMMWSKLINRMQMARANIFISQFSLELAQKYGLQPNYARDIVFPNRIAMAETAFVKKTLDDKIILCSMARDVPHKNLKGVIEIAEKIKELSKKEVELYLTSTKYKSDKILIVAKNFSDQERNEIYAKAHFNLLLSLDHGHKGQVEGFGLTPLEAAVYSTPSIVAESGGLPESVHDNRTGWVLSDLTNEIDLRWSMIEKSYQEVAKNAYEHVRIDHGAQDYQELIGKLL